MKTCNFQEESEEEVVSKKPTKVLSIQRKADWLRNKDKKKTLSDTDEETNGSGYALIKHIGAQNHQPSQKGI